MKPTTELRIYRFTHEDGSVTDILQQKWINDSDEFAPAEVDWRTIPIVNAEDEE